MRLFCIKINGALVIKLSGKPKRLYSLWKIWESIENYPFYNLGGESLYPNYNVIHSPLINCQACLSYDDIP